VSQRVVILGEYGLRVIKGQITILGATLSPAHTFGSLNVFAPSSHALPVIRYLESTDNEVVINLYEGKSRLRELSRLSPLFSRLWNERATILNGETDSDEKSSFQIVCLSACHTF
jgi:polynucleotide 5'-hydroxyl-kinase GRC3/NOL9